MKHMFALAYIPGGLYHSQVAVPRTIYNRTGSGTGATRTPLPATQGVTKECQPQFLRAAEGAQPAWETQNGPRAGVSAGQTRG